MDGTTDSMDMRLSKLWETVKDREAWCAVGHGVSEKDVTEWLNSSLFPVRAITEAPYAGSG